MTPETKAALEAFVLQIIEAAKTGAQWSADQAPVLVQQWLQWQVINASITLGICAVFLLILWTAVLWPIPAWVYHDMLNSYYHKDDEARARKEARDARGAGSAVAGIISVLLMITLIADSVRLLLKIAYAPNVVVFEKFIELVK